MSLAPSRCRMAPSARGGRSGNRLRRMLVGLAAVSLASMAIVAVPATARAITLPEESEASDTYVAVSNPPSIETVDSNTGSQVGSPVSLACPPLAEGEWWPSGTASSELVVAEESSSECTGTSENAVQTVNTSSGATSSQIALASTPSAVVVADDASSQGHHLRRHPRARCRRGADPRHLRRHPHEREPRPG